jgi:uncharacterized protein (TIGR03435 family)
VLAETLSRTELNKTVLNNTGIHGRFDVNMTWAVDPSAPGLYDKLGGAAVPGIVVDEPSIFIALQEQLGLKLEGGRGRIGKFQQAIDRAAVSAFSKGLVAVCSS